MAKGGIEKCAELGNEGLVHQVTECGPLVTSVEV